MGDYTLERQIATMDMKGGIATVSANYKNISGGDITISEVGLLTHDMTQNQVLAREKYLIALQPQNPEKLSLFLSCQTSTIEQNKYKIHREVFRQRLSFIVLDFKE